MLQVVMVADGLLEFFFFLSRGFPRTSCSTVADDVTESIASAGRSIGALPAIGWLVGFFPRKVFART